jgi:F-type H+-transporting ATPase subunit delta
MSASSTARRYAEALFDVVRKSGSEERASRDLSDLARLFSSHAELNRLISSPAIPAGVKRNIVVAIMDAAGDVSPEVRRMVLMLAERDRLPALTDMAAAFSARLLEAQRVVRADVVTAVPLTDANRAALTGALAKATGKTVTISERVDPAIVGGLVARVGSMVYDASVTRQLERIREKLTTSN